MRSEILFVIVLFTPLLAITTQQQVQKKSSSTSELSWSGSDEISISFAIQVPDSNRTYYTSIGKPLRVIQGFMIRGDLCPSHGWLILDFRDGRSQPLAVVRHEWTKNNVSIAAGDLGPGFYELHMSIELPPKLGEKKGEVLPIQDPYAFKVEETDLRLTSNWQRVNEKQKDFIWLVQHHEYMDLSEMKSSRSDALILVWKIKPPDHLIYPRGDAIWSPNCTLTDGRNQLVHTAKTSEYPDYLYFILRDGDMVLKERKDYGMNTGNPYRTFEKYLRKWEPAVGFVWYEWQELYDEKEVQLSYNFDQILVAFHLETLGVLLPYTRRWVNESWHHCGRTTSLLSAALYNEHRIQFNALEAINAHHEYYPKSGGYEKPLAFALGALRNSSQTEQLWFEWIDSSRAKYGTPKMKNDISYRVNSSIINPCHSFFRDNPYFPEIYPQIVKEYWDHALCNLDTDLSLVHALGLWQREHHRVGELEKKVAYLENVVERTRMDSLRYDVDTSFGRSVSSSPSPFLMSFHALHNDVSRLEDSLRYLKTSVHGM